MAFRRMLATLVVVKLAAWLVKFAAWLKVEQATSWRRVASDGRPLGASRPPLRKHFNVHGWTERDHMKIDTNRANTNPIKGMMSKSGEIRPPDFGKLKDDPNPPHGERGSFRKVTVTLPPQMYNLLVKESARRKMAHERNHLLSELIREALRLQQLDDRSDSEWSPPHSSIHRSEGQKTKDGATRGKRIS
jgi:hypothetical protein